MLKSDRHIRLTREELQKLYAATGADASGITTQAELTAFIEQHAAAIPPGSPEAEFKRHLLRSFLHGEKQPFPFDFP